MIPDFVVVSLVSSVSVVSLVPVVSSISVVSFVPVVSSISVVSLVSSISVVSSVSLVPVVSLLSPLQHLNTKTLNNSTLPYPTVPLIKKITRIIEIF